MGMTLGKFVGSAPNGEDDEPDAYHSSLFLSFFLFIETIARFWSHISDQIVLRHVKSMRQANISSRFHRELPWQKRRRPRANPGPEQEKFKQRRGGEA